MTAMPRITGKTKDEVPRILELMADGRERTVSDISARLKMKSVDVQFFLRSLARRQKVSATQWQDGTDAISIWKIK